MIIYVFPYIISHRKGVYMNKLELLYNLIDTLKQGETDGAMLVNLTLIQNLCCVDFYDVVNDNIETIIDNDLPAEAILPMYYGNMTN